MTDYENIDENISPESFANPFKGPDSYTESDTLYFYGRDGERNDLINLIEQNTLTLLYSRSGIGKSSLINAGLIPALKKSIFYFPVYIRLSDEMISGEIKTFSQAVVKIIKDEAVKRKVKIEVKKESKVFIRENPGITEFLYFSEFIFDVNKTVIPVIIFDQFEEIFSKRFHNANIKDLIEDFSYVIESKIPEDTIRTENDNDAIAGNFESKPENKIFGIDLFKNYCETDRAEEIYNLRNNLQHNLKNYRFLFSFRDEFLPRFESLTNKLPSIFKMSGRLNLQTFSIKLASKLITRISSNSLEIDKKLSEHLAKIISSSDKKFESQFLSIKDEVQPFLLSLVCKKLYPEIVGKNAKKNTIELIEKEDSQIVDNIVSEYTEEIFSKISKKTRKFIEEELITENERRKLFPLSEVDDEEIRKELNNLSQQPDLRYLNIVQYFNSSNVEILHDRLLKPLIESRKKRREKEEEEILEEKKKKIDEENRLIVKKLRRRFLIAGLVLITGIGLLYFVLKSYDPFLRDSNSVRLEKLSAEIPQNSVGALITMAKYQKSVDSIGGIKGVHLLPGFIDPLTDTKDRLDTSIIHSMKKNPLFFSVPDTSGSRFNVSLTGKYKYSIKWSSSSKKDRIFFYELKNDSVPDYTELSVTNAFDIDEEYRNSFRIIPGIFSPDERYFAFSNKDSILIFDLKKSFDTITPKYKRMGKDISLFKFSLDSKLLLFKNKKDSGYYSLRFDDIENPKIGMAKSKFTKFSIPDSNYLYDALIGSENNIIYFTYKKISDDYANYHFLNGISDTIVEGYYDITANHANRFVTLFRDTIKILDLNTFRLETIVSGIKNTTNLSLVGNKEMFIVVNKYGEVELYNIGDNKNIFNAKFNFDSTMKKSNYYNNLICFVSDTGNKILIGYNNEFRVYDLHDSIYKRDFGFLKMNLKYAYFNPDTSITFIDIKGNIVKWYYEKKSPENIDTLLSYGMEFMKIYPDSTLKFSTDFLGTDSVSNRSWLNRIRWY